jgi:L-fucose mutarotase
MLKNISPVFSPELLAAIYAMGHGDTLVLADGNFPSEGVSRRQGAKIIRADGHGIPELLDAILALMPLDTYIDKPVEYMAKSACDADLVLPIMEVYSKILANYDSRGNEAACYLDRYDFYDKAAKACYIVQTGETSQYANIILTKGVVKFTST